MSQETGKTSLADTGNTTGLGEQPSIKSREIEEFSPGQTEVNIDDIIVSLEELPSKTTIQKKGEISSARRLNNHDKEDLIHYLPLYKAIINGDWESANENYYYKDRDSVTAKITEDSDTALHIAVATATTKGTHFVKKLVELMPKEAQALPNINGDTALHVAAAFGNTEAAKLLVMKNPELPHIQNYDGLLPLHAAAEFGRTKMIHYLLGVTKDEELSRLTHESRFQLLILLLAAGLYGEILDLLLQYPELATMKCQEQTFLGEIAGNPSAFRSGTILNTRGRIVYNNIPEMLMNLPQHPTGRVEDNPTTKSMGPKLCRVFWEWIEASVPQIKRIRCMKQQHFQLLGLIKHLCKKAADLDYLRAYTILKHPLLSSVQLGIHEVVREIMESFPYAIHFRDEKNRSIFQLAVMNRQPVVFNVILELCDNTILVTSSRDTYGNNILHLTGLLAPRDQLLRLPNPALRMQSEIRWFKHVEKHAPPIYKTQMNSEHKTPVMVFKEEHRHLVKEAEIWLKDTANSCSVVAALVATIAFAAAITVPGGNNSDNGHPIFSKEKAFTIFAVSNALSLLASTTSLLLFLCILTSRYEESDFLYSLPDRLIWNLHLLFLSVLFMLIAFCATIYLVFGNGKSQILILVTLCGSLPITLFMFMQYPLLSNIFVHTYVGRMLGRLVIHI